MKNKHEVIKFRGSEYFALEAPIINMDVCGNAVPRPKKCTR